MSRRRFQRGRSQRRRTYWESLATVNSGETTQIAASVAQILLYSIPASSDVTNTLVRIVGNVYMGLQTQQAVMALCSWGIYIGQSGGGGSLRFVPDAILDLSEETWLHVRHHAQKGQSTEWNRTDTEVDIKVMRKLEGGKELRICLSCINFAYVHQVNLRALFMAT